MLLFTLSRPNAEGGQSAEESKCLQHVDAASKARVEGGFPALLLSLCSLRCVQAEGGLC